MAAADASAAQAVDEPCAPPFEAGADERLLAWVRVGSLIALLFILLTDRGPGHSAAVEILTGVYLAYALVLVGLSYARADWLARRVGVLHTIDFAWTAAASTISGGAGSHAFSFFAFVVATAAFRWGLARAFVNAFLVLAVGVMQNAAAATGLTPWAIEFDHFLLQVSYVTSGMAVLFGFLADRLHRSRHQAAATAALVASITRAGSIRGGLSSTLAGIAHAMQAARVVVVAEDSYTGNVAVWNAVTLGDRVSASDEDVPHERAAEWLPTGGWESPACEFRRRGAVTRPIVALYPGEGLFRERHSTTLAPAVLRVPDWRTVLVIPFSAAGAWRGHLYVMDPAARPGSEFRLRFLTDLVRQATPALLNLYLQRRLRWRAESVERSRISRELHDTANQSLAAISMLLELLGRNTSDSSCRFHDELREIQALVRRVDLDLRESVAQRPCDLDARRLPLVLADIVDRFSRQSGIEAKLDWNVAQLNLPPQHCSEVARIVQEALFNVRRHSGASRVQIRVEANATSWRAIIEDNGRGLGFTGRLSGDQPELRLKAPRVIRERSVVLGGSLAIESSSGGTRLEMTFPQPRSCFHDQHSNTAS